MVELVWVFGIAGGINFTKKDKKQRDFFGSFGVFFECLDEDYEVIGSLTHYVEKKNSINIFKYRGSKWREQDKCLNHYLKLSFRII